MVFDTQRLVSRWFHSNTIENTCKMKWIVLLWLSFNETKLSVSGVRRSTQCRLLMQWNHKIQIICKIRDEKNVRRMWAGESVVSLALAWINALNEVTNGIRQISLVHTVHRLHPIYATDASSAQVPLLTSCNERLRVEFRAPSMRYSRTEAVSIYSLPADFHRLTLESSSWHCIRCEYQVYL